VRNFWGKNSILWKIRFFLNIWSRPASVVHKGHHANQHIAAASFCSSCAKTFHQFPREKLSAGFEWASTFSKWRAFSQIASISKTSFSIATNQQNKFSLTSNACCRTSSMTCVTPANIVEGYLQR
jgi:hypothetical protein